MFLLFQILVLIDGFFMWSLIGRGALGLILGAQRETNPVYRVFTQVVKPLLNAVRWGSLGRLSNRYLASAAVVLLLLLRVALYMVWYANGWIPAGIGAANG